MIFIRLAWADVLREAAAYGRDERDDIRLKVASAVDGVPRAVWTHLRGEHLVAARRLLGVLPDGEAQVLDVARTMSGAVHDLHRGCPGRGPHRAHVRHAPQTTSPA